MINYENLHLSTLFYETAGYQRIESPWTVTRAVSNITKPPIVKVDYEIQGKNKVLVASAEQSFLYLYLKGFLPKGRFQSITPCFRDEIFDAVHTKYFMKNELIITDKVEVTELKKMVDDAFKFFSQMLKNSSDLKIITLVEDEQYDIEYKGIELSSKWIG